MQFKSLAELPGSVYSLSGMHKTHISAAKGWYIISMVLNLILPYQNAHTYPE
jgi:hypothetical protein